MSNLISDPVAPIEEILITQWKEMLNLKEVGLDDDFFDLGGNSLLAIRAITMINKELGFKLAVSTIYQLSTIRQLAYKIERFESEELKSIVLLKEGFGTPLFIFPPWSSYPTIFNEFVQTYNKSNPIYGIIYYEDADDFPFKDLHEYANYLVGEIKKLHPQGPYSLLGCSMGARTILEVAMQLQKSGDKIEFLGAISHYPSYPSKGLLLNRRVLDEIRTLVKIDLRLKIKYLRHRLPHFLKLLVTGNNAVQEIVIENGAQNQILAIHEIYDPKSKYNGDLVLIYETSPEGVPSELTKSQVYRNSIFKLLWKQYVTGNIIAKIVECKHNDFFKKPAVNQVAAIVESYAS
ncbi:thioesterase domain-containing protein [Mucilaginibacter sp. McL0603]|uniref:thioesterase domain-containing protein n=1 Tax=Mucilaginibacter sp. McL0603 TaxID=3415670 RepID=UPI003CED8A2E